LKIIKENLVHSGKVVITCRLSPGAKNTEIKGFMSDDSLKIRVASAPENGRANLELRQLLSKELEVDINNVRIITGGKSKLKLVEIIK